METRLEKEVRFWKVYAAMATLFCAAFFLLAFAAQSKKQKFEEIDVERINIVEKDGKLRMVISNQERQHPGIVNGKVIKRDGPRPPGMIFFNHLGDEMGGLIFGDNGGNGHFGSLTFDKVRNDQTIGFRHLEGDDGTYRTGLEVWQRPNLPLDVVEAKWEAARKIPDEAARKAAIQALIDNNESTQQRLFLGKQRDNAAELLMSDVKGRPRIRMQVAPDGTPKLEFLDEAGKVIYSLPTASSAPKP
ncbi:MAG TPA: hypothetical protein VIA62_03000 [Thermoanaerobaculia bacterium]|jgi:hypothetical protein|nr:hypothetical protein [Thermoanaerobaculia bacterium]